jgi:hypothetical protein
MQAETVSMQGDGINGASKRRSGFNLSFRERFFGMRTLLEPLRVGLEIPDSSFKTETLWSYISLLKKRGRHWPLMKKSVRRATLCF